MFNCAFHNLVFNHYLLKFRTPFLSLHKKITPQSKKICNFERETNYKIIHASKVKRLFCVGKKENEYRSKI